MINQKPKRNKVVDADMSYDEISFLSFFSKMFYDEL